MNRSKIGNLDDDSVARSVRAAEGYHHSRQVPDPFDRKDYIKRPDLVALALRQRVQRGDEWGSPSVVTSPKLTGGDRILIVLDPLAEVLFRRKGDNLLAVGSELSDSILHARITNQTGSEWRIRSWRERHPQWERLKAVSHMPLIGSGMLDVKDHYPTISNDHLADLLRSYGIPEANVQDLFESLESLHSISGIPSGLPVDMELSALLGTAALLPVDGLLLNEKIEFYRWVDDLLLLGVSEEHFIDVSGRIAQVLGSRGQRLNEEKTCWLDHPQDGLPYAMEILTDMSPDRAADTLREAAASCDFVDVAKAFGALTKASAIIGLELIAEYPVLLFRAPFASGKYLRRMSGDRITDQWEPLSELLPVSGIEPDRELAMVHLARCFPRQPLSAQFRREAWDWCVSMGVASAPTLAGFMVDLVFRGIRGRQIKQFRREALELINEVPDFGFQRVLVGALRYGGTLPEGDANRLRELGRRDPSLACTIEWVLAA